MINIKRYLFDMAAILLVVALGATGTVSWSVLLTPFSVVLVLLWAMLGKRVFGPIRFGEESDVKDSWRFLSAKSGRRVLLGGSLVIVALSVLVRFAAGSGLDGPFGLFEFYLILFLTGFVVIFAENGTLSRGLAFSYFAYSLIGSVIAFLALTNMFPDPSDPHSVTGNALIVSFSILLIGTCVPGMAIGSWLVSWTMRRI